MRSGGYLVINQTEALVAVDENSGRSTRERNIEATALKTNMVAAEEAADTGDEDDGGGHRTGPRRPLVSLAELATLYAGLAEQLAVLLLGHPLAALLDH